MNQNTFGVDRMYTDGVGSPETRNRSLASPALGAASGSNAVPQASHAGYYIFQSSEGTSFVAYSWHNGSEK